MSAHPLGDLPVTFATPEEAEQVDAVVCMRKADARFVVRGSREEPCSECGHTVVVAPSSPKTPPRLCVQCALDHARGGVA